MRVLPACISATQAPTGYTYCSHQLKFCCTGRIPAGFNGCVGLKATLGRVSTTGVVPACASLDCLTCFATTVRDAATVVQIMQASCLPCSHAALCSYCPMLTLPYARTALCSYCPTLVLPYAHTALCSYCPMLILPYASTALYLRCPMLILLYVYSSLYLYCPMVIPSRAHTALCSYCLTLILPYAHSAPRLLLHYTLTVLCTCCPMLKPHTANKSKEWRYKPKKVWFFFLVIKPYRTALCLVHALDVLSSVCSQ